MSRDEQEKLLARAERGDRAAFKAFLANAQEEFRVLLDLIRKMPSATDLQRPIGALGEALDELRARAGTPRWISVVERLPESGCPVLAFDDGESQFGIGRLDDSLAVRDEDGIRYTHWMPLPEPPEGA